jgi:hypothetical protein
VSYTLKYKTFDSLMADVMIDFKTFNQNNLIEPQELIRVVKWVNSDLGLRITKTREVLLELSHGKVRLPDDFYVFNYGLLCGEGSYTVPIPQGVKTEMIPYPSYVDAPEDPKACTTSCPTETPACGGCGSCDICEGVQIPGYNPLYPTGNTCVKPRVFMSCKGESFELIQVVGTETRHWKYMLPLRLVNNTHQIACGCPNLYATCPDHIWIKDGFLWSNLKCGNVYINYQGQLENENGELLLLDHDKITPFYEYELKRRILENLFMNGEDVEKRLDYITQQCVIARADAWRVVKTPNFEEMLEMWKMNRKAYNARYVDAFRSCNWIGNGAGWR